MEKFFKDKQFFDPLKDIEMLIENWHAGYFKDMSLKDYISYGINHMYSNVNGVLKVESFKHTHEGITSATITIDREDLK